MVEISYLRNACGVRRMDGESNESVYNRFSTSTKGMKCGVVEGIKHSTLERMAESEKMRNVYVSMIDVIGAGR